MNRKKIHSSKLKASVKKGIILFFSFLIIAPYFIQTIHELQHEEQEHCTEKTNQHFHEAEHNCQFCHFQISVATPQDFTFTIPIEQVDFTKSSIVVLSFFYSESFRHFSLRAPPVI